MQSGFGPVNEVIIPEVEEPVKDGPVVIVGEPVALEPEEPVTGPVIPAVPLAS